jgi:hypothetical protein
MSVRPPIGGQEAVSPEALPPSKKPKREEEKVEKIVEGTIPKEKYQPEKKLKRDTQRVAPTNSEAVEEVHAVGEEVISARKKLQHTVNDLFEGPRNKLSLEQKIQALSFIYDNQLHIDDRYWFDVIIPKESYETSTSLQTTLKEIPERERIALIRDCLPFLSSLASDDLIKDMYKLSEEERQRLIQDTTSLFTDSTKAEEKTRLLMIMSEVPTAERASLIQDSLPLFDEDMSADDKADLLYRMRAIPQEERAPLIQDTLPLFDEGMSAGEKLKLLDTMHRIPQEERALLIQDASPFFTDSMQAEDKATLLRTMSTIPTAERSSLIQDALPLFNEDMDASDKLELLHAMRYIPQAERASLIQETLPLVNKAMSVEDKSDLLNEMRAIPQAKRASLIQEILPKLPILRKVIDTSPIVIFYLLPEELKTIERLKASKSLFKDPEYKAALVAALACRFSDETAPALLQQKLADFANRYQEELNLHEEHPVMLQAIEILSASSVVEEKNPFSLHKKLQELAKEPTTFQPPGFRLDQLQAYGKAFNVPRNELPQDATLEAWQLAANGLKQKVESNAAAKNALKKEYGTTWEQVWKGCLSDPYLSGLLTLSTGKVSIVEAQFRAILHHLLTKERAVKEGALFSEQEDLLIHQAMSIQYCPGGKKEGIAVIYKSLDPIYKYPAKGLAEGDADRLRAKEFLATWVQDVLSDQFSGTNALMQELTGTKNIEQAAHQAIYLKNLIGPLVGLHHEVTFDSHTGVLYESLVAKSRDEVLEAFFRHFTPQLLVNELMRVINNDISKMYKIVKPLMSGSAGWDYDEETYKTTLNEQGALQILQTAGFLK